MSSTAFVLEEKKDIRDLTPQKYCDNCLRISGVWNYAKKEDCVCDCHKDFSPPKTRG